MPLPLIVSCSSKIQIGFTFLVPAHPGIGKRAVKRVSVTYISTYILTATTTTAAAVTAATTTTTTTTTVIRPTVRLVAVVTW